MARRPGQGPTGMGAGAADPGGFGLDLAGGGTAASSIGRPWRFCRGEGERDVRPVRERRKRRVTVARYSPVARKRRGGELISWLPAARQTRTAGFGSSGRRVGLKQRRQRRSKTRASAAMQHEDGGVEARGGLHGESRRGALLLASAWISSGSWFERGHRKTGLRGAPLVVVDSSGGVDWLDLSVFARTVRSARFDEARWQQPATGARLRRRGGLA